MTVATQPVVLPAESVPAITAEVRRYGRLDLETGGFLLGPEAEPTRIEVIALAGDRGIERAWGLFRVSGRAVERIFAWAEERALRIPAQFHSHDRGARLSPLDRREGFNVRGFISCVVPSYRTPPTDPGAWGWWWFDGTAWVHAPGPVLRADEVTVVTFDEAGVRARA
jgi:hypothetical protein